MKRSLRAAAFALLTAFVLTPAAAGTGFGNMFGTPEMPEPEHYFPNISAPEMPSVTNPVKAPSYIPGDSLRDVTGGVREGVSDSLYEYFVPDFPTPAATPAPSAPDTGRDIETVSPPPRLFASSTGTTDTPDEPSPDTSPSPTPPPSPSPSPTPEIRTAQLTENYDIMLGMYEQTFDNGYSFLANIPNGGRTRDEVYVEFPKNLRVIAEFDGTVIKYSSRQRLTDTGYYVFSLYCPEADGSESKAVFSFRILPHHVRSINATAENPGPQIEEFFAVSSSDGRTVIEYIFSNHKRFFANVADGETVTGPVYFNLAPNLGHDLRRNGRTVAFGNNKPFREPGNYVMRISAPPYARSGYRSITPFTVISFTIYDPDEDTQDAPAFNPGTDYQPDYQPDPKPAPSVITDTLTEIPEDDGMYRMAFSNGFSFVSSAANGAVSAEPVFFRIPNEIEYELFAGNTLIPYSSGEMISAPGAYRLSVATLPWAANDPVYTSSVSFAVIEASEPGTVEPPDAPDDGVLPGITLPSNAVFPEQTYSGGLFMQYIAQDIYFTSTVPNGMMGNLPVEFNIPGYVESVLKINGWEEEFLGDETFSEQGNYELTVTNPITGEEFLFFFVMLPRYTNISGMTYMPPPGYEIASLVKDGAAFPYDVNGAVFASDGLYIIQLTGEYGFPQYTVDLTIDTVAPTLEIIGVEDGKAVDAEVVFWSDDPDAMITVFLGGNEIQSNGTLTKDGKYRITITDPAGNYNEYEFAIPYRMNKTAVLLVVLVVLILGGGAVYFLRLRKNAKV